MPKRILCNSLPRFASNLSSIFASRFLLLILSAFLEFWNKRLCTQNWRIETKPNSRNMGDEIIMQRKCLHAEYSEHNAIEYSQIQSSYQLPAHKCSHKIVIVIAIVNGKAACVHNFHINNSVFILFSFYSTLGLIRSFVRSFIRSFAYLCLALCVCVCVLMLVIHTIFAFFFCLSDTKIMIYSESQCTHTEQK